MSKTIKISREELYRRVWEIPLTELGEELQISAAHIAAACDKHRIPRPSSGYWMQRERGLPIENIPPLPESEQKEITLNHPPTRIKGSDYPVVLVPDRLTAPLPIITATLEHLRDQKADRDGLVHTYDEKYVRASVSPAQIVRACRILDTFLKAMKSDTIAMGTTDGGRRKRFGLTSGGEDFPVRITERLIKYEIPPLKAEIESAKRWGHKAYSRTEQRPKGELIFTFGEDYAGTVVVSDSETIKIEQAMGKAVAKAQLHIINRIEKAHAWAAERERQEAEDRERRRAAAEAEKHRQEEEKRVAKLKADVQSWRLAADIRLYLSEIRQTVVKAGMKATVGGQRISG